MKKMGCIAGWLFFLLIGVAYAADSTAVQTQVLVKTNDSWNGAALPDYPKGHPEITILRITIPPGAILPVHQHPVINAGVLISGALTVITKNGQTLRLAAGDPIVEVVGTWHYGKNEGSQPADIIVFYAGTAETALSIKE